MDLEYSGMCLLKELSGILRKQETERKLKWIRLTSLTAYLAMEEK